MPALLPAADGDAEIRAAQQAHGLGLIERWRSIEARTRATSERDREERHGDERRDDHGGAQAVGREEDDRDQANAQGDQGAATERVVQAREQRNGRGCSDWRPYRALLYGDPGSE